MLEKHSVIRKHLARIGVIAAAMAATVQVQAMAADLIVKVSGVGDAAGQVGCALFKNPEGFPMDNAGARQLWLPADPKGVTCRFGDVTDGSYAVSVSHDPNGNKKVDTNFLGIPTEAWGVSNNARPTLRAPRFSEAAFRMVEGKDMTIDIRVAK